MTIQSDAYLNHLRRLELNLSATEAQTKAIRMQVRTLIDERERALKTATDMVMAQLDEPTELDWEEFNELRFDSPSPREAFMDHVMTVDFDIEEGAYDS